MGLLKLFADHCVPFSIVQALRKAGIEVLVLKDHIPPDSPDSVVISKADELNAVLITLNVDFADIVSYPPEKYKGIISLQIRNHPETIPLLISKLKEYFLAHPAKDDYVGKLIIVEAHRIRIRS
jgi:predicted nuclease of predicted toxin-antitoxin system